MGISSAGSNVTTLITTLFFIPEFGSFQCSYPYKRPFLNSTRKCNKTLLYIFFLLSSCSRDNTLKYTYTKGASHNFSVSAFRFKENYDDVYIHCKLTVCRESDAGSRCDRGCEASRRRRRSIQEDFSAEVRIGPLSYKSMVDKQDGMCNCLFVTSSNTSPAIETTAAE